MTYRFFKNSFFKRNVSYLKNMFFLIKVSEKHLLVKKNNFFKIYISNACASEASFILDVEHTSLPKFQE